jgi:hypothetical protein
VGARIARRVRATVATPAIARLTSAAAIGPDEAAVREAAATPGAAIGRVNASIGARGITQIRLILAKIQLARRDCEPDQADDREDEEPTHEYLRPLGR